MPDSKNRTESTNINDWPALLEQCQDLLPDIVWRICRRYDRFPRPEKIEDHVGDMMLYLLAHDYHNLKTYDPDKGELKPWLFVVTEHELRHRFKREKAWDSLDEPLLEQLLELPQQERNAITQEQLEAVARVVAKLSARRRQLFALLWAGYSPAEIAEQMQIKIATVHWMTHELIQKIREGIKNNGEANCVPERARQKIKIIEKSDPRFFVERAIWLVVAAFFLDLPLRHMISKISEIEIFQHHFQKGIT
jgi:RNA polymerase sigma factor (sigma-70 family)